MTKFLYFIRSASSYHPLGFPIEESVLINKGLTQCKDFKKYSIYADLVLTSPLIRSLQTTDIIFKDHSNIIALDSLKHMSSPPKIKNKLFIQKYPNIIFHNNDINIKEFYKNCDFDDDQNMNKRIEQTKKFITSRPISEQQIAIVGHNTYLTMFMNYISKNKNITFTDKNLEHCCPYILKF